jgi:hypothetical protein
MAETPSPKVLLFMTLEVISQEERAVDRIEAKVEQAAEGSVRGMVMTRQNRPNLSGKRLIESNRARSHES